VQIEVGGGSGVEVTAKPGQLIRVKETDENGNPTAWSAVDAPYVENGGMVEILAECQPPIVDDDIFAVTENAPTLVVGQTYIVNWNGTEYTCVGQDMSAMTPGAVFLGDGSTVGMPSNGEPFAIVSVLENDTQVLSVIPFDGTTELTLSIKGMVETVHKLDNRCLDLEWLPTVEKIDTMVYEPNMIASGANLFEYTRLPVGTNVAVMFDDVRYECVVEQNSATGWFVIGNLSIVNAEEFHNTDEPFVIRALFETGLYFVGFADGNNHKIAVYKVDAAYNKLPEEFLPESAATKEYVNEMLGVIENGTY
jgi:hypothetical protein